jgi:hypothetical protein
MTTVSRRKRIMTGVGKEDVSISKISAKRQEETWGKFLTGELHSDWIFEAVDIVEV